MLREDRIRASGETRATRAECHTVGKAREEREQMKMLGE